MNIVQMNTDQRITKWRVIASIFSVALAIVALMLAISSHVKYRHLLEELRELKQTEPGSSPYNQKLSDENTDK
jgi:hypothetical protein